MGVYDRLGVRPVINARGMNTMASGSLMPPPVLSAMAEAARAFVDMAELNARAGERIAELIGVEAAHVTSGSAGARSLRHFSQSSPLVPISSPTPPTVPSTTGQLSSGYGATQPRKWS